MTDIASHPVQIDQLTHKDVTPVAVLHRRVFPDYFLTHLGQEFLERFYGEFVDQPGSYAVTATSDGTHIGFVVGTSAGAAFYRGFYRHHLLPLAGILIWRFLRNPYVRRNITARIPHLRLVLTSLFRLSTSGEESKSCNASARLLSIGIAPEAQGRGIGEELLDRFLQILREHGIKSVDLSVRADNARAIGFYRKTGWHQERASDSTVYFNRSTEPLSDEGGPNHA